MNATYTREYGAHFDYWVKLCFGFDYRGGDEVAGSQKVVRSPVTRDRLALRNLIFVESASLIKTMNSHGQ